MPTKITPLYSKQSETQDLGNYMDPFYCKESPSTVLATISNKFPIKKFKSIEAKLGIYERKYLDRKRSNSSIFFEGMQIEECSEKTEDFAMKHSIANYKPELPNAKFKKKRKLEIISFLISDYLIETDVIEEGNATLGIGGKTIESTPGKQKVVNYLKVRKSVKPKLKENYLKEILEYSRALLGDGFSFEDLEKLALEVEENTPTKIAPQNTVHATLKRGWI